ncbi:MAG: Fur family transcriptional regulator [bacterium]
MGEAINRLKKKGLVLTSQRIAILELMEGRGRHLTAKDIYKMVKKRFPTISFATVYNTLEKLVDVGEIKQLSIKRDVAYYDGNVSPHHHFHCRICGRIYDVEVECSVAKKGEVEGHKIEEMQAYFYGVCKECREK